MGVFAWTSVFLKPQFWRKLPLDRHEVLSKVQQQTGVTYKVNDGNVCLIQGNWEDVLRAYEAFQEIEKNILTDSQSGSQETTENGTGNRGDIQSQLQVPSSNIDIQQLEAQYRTSLLMHQIQNTIKEEPVDEHVQALGNLSWNHQLESENVEFEMGLKSPKQEGDKTQANQPGKSVDRCPSDKSYNVGESRGFEEGEEDDDVDDDADNDPDFEIESKSYDEEDDDDADSDGDEEAQLKDDPDFEIELVNNSMTQNKQPQKRKAKQSGETSGCKKKAKKNAILTCEECPYETSDRKCLRDHKKAIHGPKIHKCEVCGRAFGLKKHFLRHVREHNIPKVACAICDKEFCNERNRDLHVKKQHEGSGCLRKAKKKAEILKCEDCSYETSNRRCLNNHQQTVHGPKIHKCEICGRMYGLKKHFLRHVRDHAIGRAACGTCGKEFSNERTRDAHAKKHEVDYVPEVHVCMVCNKGFSTEYVLRKHILVSHEGAEKKRWYCSVCGKDFSSKHSMLQHQSIIHGGERPFSCKLCMRTFRYAKSMEYHITTFHNQARDFMCSTCGKTFTSKVGLKMHSKIHLGDYQHTCNVCGKKFIQKQAMIRHERIHTGDRPFKCQVCPDRFNDYSILRRHIMFKHKDEGVDWRRRKPGGLLPPSLAADGGVSSETNPHPSPSADKEESRSPVEDLLTADEERSSMVADGSVSSETKPYPSHSADKEKSQIPKKDVGISNEERLSNQEPATPSPAPSQNDQPVTASSDPSA